MPPHLLREVQHFFSIYRNLEDVAVDVMGGEGRTAALRIIYESRARCDASRVEPAG